MALANNLTNSRYFNYTLVDAIRPDPLDKELELAPDIQSLIEEQKRTEDQAATMPTCSLGILFSGSDPECRR